MWEAIEATALILLKNCKFSPDFCRDELVGGWYERIAVTSSTLLSTTSLFYFDGLPYPVKS